MNISRNASLLFLFFSFVLIHWKIKRHYDIFFFSFFLFFFVNFCYLTHNLFLEAWQTDKLQNNTPNKERFFFFLFLCTFLFSFLLRSNIPTIRNNSNRIRHFVVFEVEKKKKENIFWIAVLLFSRMRKLLTFEITIHSCIERSTKCWNLRNKMFCRQRISNQGQQIHRNHATSASFIYTER